MPISTIPAAGLSSGVPTRAQLPAGAVLQVVNNTYSSTETYTNTSFATSSFSLTITPTSATSKILVTGSINLYTTATIYNVITVYRNNATNLGGTTWGFGSIYGNTGDRFGQVSFTYLDSPATTSTVTYTIYRRVSSGTGNINLNAGELSTLTLTEVAA
jgi:hypothetical protein